ncbi:MAG: hypothetical protein HHJ11_11960 [Phycicoccus sp.]|nr:hypothetical protein [Phycicoccus sp.]
MTRERDELARFLGEPADGGIPWLPGAWRKWVPVDCVPTPLVQTAVVRKQDLYELAAVVADGGDDRAVAGLVIAVQAWGSGIAGQGGDGRGPSRAASGLGLGKRSPNDRLVPARLEAVRQAVALSATDVAAAWRSLKRGPGHLPGWDEPFFTKLMHAAGYRQSGRPWPLIFDGRVRSALSSIGRTPHGYGLADYMTYIQLADQWSDEWGVSPAQVEYALFSHAGRMSTASQAHA